MTFALQSSSSTVVVDGSTIAHHDAKTAFAVDLGSGTLHSGFINAHDHLYFNHYPRLGTPPYRSAYDWVQDVRSRYTKEIDRASALPRDEAMLFGALKNLLGGVTTVVHHDRWEPSVDESFPIRVARLRIAHSLKLEPNMAAAIAGDSFTSEKPFSIHLAEGTDKEAAGEIREAARRGLINHQLVAVHVVGIDEHGIELLSNAKAAVVWCPTSNNFLYGCTVTPQLFQSRVDILLGTDSLLTGDGTLLDELRAARNTNRLNHGTLLQAVGETAARRLMLPTPSLEPGSAADVVFLRRPIFEAKSRDVSLVLVGGQPRLGDVEFAELFDRCGVKTEALSVGGRRKLVASPLATIAAKAIELAPECGRILN